MISVVLSCTRFDHLYNKKTHQVTRRSNSLLKLNDIGMLSIKVICIPFN